MFSEYDQSSSENKGLLDRPSLQNKMATFSKTAVMILIKFQYFMETISLSKHA
jgi:hypothetical protein